MNKRNRSVWMLVMFLSVFLGNTLMGPISEASSGKTSILANYTSPSPPVYTGYGKSSQYVSMSDGTKLAVDVYLPSGGPAERPSFPVLFGYSGYRRASIDLKTGDIKPFFPNMKTFLELFTAHGYAVVLADARGSGASFGSRFDMSPQLARDGKQLIDWIETQPWCNGNVGMFGGSYLGWSQFATAGQNPDALKAIMPELVPFDLYSGGLMYSNGIYLRAFADPWSKSTKTMNRGMYMPEGPRPVLPAAPVVDEDGDGELKDEIPLDMNNNHYFYDDPPTYSDGKEREDIYYQAISEHLANADPAEWAVAAAFRNSRIAGSNYTWMDLGPSDWPTRLVESGVAIFNVGGWFDQFTLGATRWYATLRATNPSRLLIHPSFHFSPDLMGGLEEIAGPYWRYFGEDLERFGQWFLRERLRFFDHYLKGIDNGIDADQPVLIYVMNGEGWRRENEWPLARAVASRLYFNGGNSLSADQSMSGRDAYKADLHHDARFGEHKITRSTSASRIRDVVMKTPDEVVQRRLTYTTAMLEKDTEVTGHPIAHLWVSSTADWGDFFVYLEDVDETGEAYYVTDGKLRAGFAALVSGKAMLPAGRQIDVLPDLPYHGFKNTEYVDGILADGNIVHLVIDLLPTSWVFRKNHRIRVSIAASDWPTYDLHPKLSENNNASDPSNTIPSITVHRTLKYSSHIELPIIPKP